MNIFAKVTLQTLKKNRVRTIVTIIGIILSCAMITAVAALAQSFSGYMLDVGIYEKGNWHGAAYSLSWSQYENIRKDEEISFATYAQLMGYARVESENPDKPYLYVIGGEKETFFENMPVHLVTGRLPQNSQEILIPEHLYTNGGVSYQVGQTLTLELGDRMVGQDTLNQFNPYIDDQETGEQEEFVPRRTRTFQIVGVYSRPDFEEYSAPGYTAMTVADLEENVGDSYDVYFRMKKPAQVYDYLDNMDCGSATNTSVLLYSGVSRYSSYNAVLTGLVTVLVGLIMFGSVSLIYNAFAISVSERTRQFGLMSSVGATKRQLGRMVLMEALFVSVVGIPLGVLAGLGGIGITLRFVSDLMMSYSLIPVPLRLRISPYVVGAAVLLSLITVLLSAWIPSVRAKRVTAIEAIRQSQDVRGKSRPVKTGWLQYRLFGLPGVLGKKYYKNSKRKYRATIVSLFMSIVLFVSVCSYTGYLLEMATTYQGDSKVDLTFSYKEDRYTHQEIQEWIENTPSVTQTAMVQAYTLTTWIPREEIPEDTMAYLDQVKDIQGDLVDLSGIVWFVDDASFRQLLQENGLEESVFFDARNPVGVSVSTARLFDESQGKYVRWDFLKKDKTEINGDFPIYMEGYKLAETELEQVDGEWQEWYIYKNPQDSQDVKKILRDEAYEKIPLKIGAGIQDMPFYISNSIFGPQIIYPLSQRDAVFPTWEQVMGDYEYDYYILSQNHKESYDALRKTLSDAGILTTNLQDITAGNESQRATVTIIQIFTYGFVALISLIAAANVFNTISTNIHLRRRDFAMLKSVGMPRKEFTRMMNYECVLYGTRALLLGLPVSCVVTWLTWGSISYGVETDFRLPWEAMGVAVLGVFLVVGISMIYAMRKIHKDNPIDALKNENL